MAKKLIKSIVKAVEILDCFKENEELGITEISNTLDYSKSSIHDTVDTLNELGLIFKNEKTKKYSLGIKLFEYGHLFSQRNSLRSNVKSIGNELSNKYKATCHLATYDKNEIVYLDKFEYQGSIVTSYSQIGKRVPMTVTGVGKAILAYLPDDYREEYIYSKPLPSRTEHSITDLDELKSELNNIQENGYALDNEESVLGLKCLAYPIFDSNNQVIAAISVSLLTPYFTDELITKLAVDVKDAAQKLSYLTY